MLCQKITEMRCIVLVFQSEGSSRKLSWNAAGPAGLAQVCAVTLCVICGEMLLRGSRLWSAGSGRHSLYAASLPKASLASLDCCINLLQFPQGASSRGKCFAQSFTAKSCHRWSETPDHQKCTIFYIFTSEVTTAYF